MAINGEVRARSGSFNLPSSVVDCLVYVTAWLTLEPADIVMTGALDTFMGVRRRGRVEIPLEGTGTLANTVS